MSSIHVGIGQIVSSVDEAATIEMVGLGSCAGIFIAAPGALAVAAHCLLAEPTDQPTEDSRGRFVQTAVSALLELIDGAKVPRWATKSYVVGGAHVFSFGSNNPTLDIGSRNTRLAVDLLTHAGLRPDHSQTGGDMPRTAALTVATGIIDVRAGRATGAGPPTKAASAPRYLKAS